MSKTFKNVVPSNDREWILFAQRKWKLKTVCGCFVYDDFLVGILFEGIHSTCMESQIYCEGKVISSKNFQLIVNINSAVFHSKINLNKLDAFVLFNAILR